MRVGSCTSNTIHLNQNEMIFNESLIAKVVRLVKEFFYKLANCCASKSSNQVDVNEGFFSKYSWPSATKIALIAAVGIGATYLYFSYFKSFRDLSIPEQDSLCERLNPICEKAVKEYCQPFGDKIFCLKDYVDFEDWKAEVTYDSRDFICPVTLKNGTDYSSLVGRTRGERPFIKNFEAIKFGNISNLSWKDQFALAPYECFKSHILKGL